MAVVSAGRIPRRTNAVARAGSRHAVDILHGGTIAGTIAGTFSLLYLMLAAPMFGHQTVLSPLYAMASPIVGPGALIASTQQLLYVRLDALLIGLLIHLWWSALSGVLYGLVVRRWNPRPILTGVALGLAAMPVSGLNEVVGWPLLAVGYGMFGFILGHWPAARPGDFRD